MDLLAGVYTEVPTQMTSISSWSVVRAGRGGLGLHVSALTITDIYRGHNLHGRFDIAELSLPSLYPFTTFSGHGVGGRRLAQIRRGRRALRSYDREPLETDEDVM